MILQIAKIVPKHVHETVLLSLVAGSAAIWSSLYILRYNLFQLSSDTGAYEQIIWNTANGRLLEGSIGPSLFAFYDAFVLPISEFPEVVPIFLSTLHTNAVAVIFAPVYLAFPYTETLLITSMTLISIGAIPLYLICHRYTNSKNLAIAVVLSYLLNPGLHAAHITDFNYLTFAVPSVLFAFYFMTRRQWIPFWACIALLLCVREEMGLVVFGLGLYMFFFQKIRRTGLATALVGVCTFAFIYFVVFGSFVDNKLLDNFAIPLDPGAWTGSTGAVLADHVHHSSAYAYLLSMFAHTGFLSVLSPAALLVSLSEVTKNLLLTSEAHRLWWNHYQLVAVLGVYLSTIFGIKRALDFAKHRRRAAAVCIIAVLISCGLFSNTFASAAPIKQASISVTEQGIEIGDRFAWWVFADPVCCFDYQKHELRNSAQFQTARAALSLIPPDASVSTEDAFIAHLSQRTHLYYFPTMYDKAEYVLVVSERQGWFGSYFPEDKHREVVGMLRDSNVHEILLDENGLVLFRAAP